MAYVKITNFAIKDSTNDVIRGTEHDDEYNAIEASFVAQPSATQTLTNKTIALGSNTVSGTTAQFNTALSDGDFATLAGTETLTNKALNGSLGATTPSTVVATDLTTTGNTILGDASTDTLNVGNGDLIKDASGNVGIGVTPSAWYATSKAVQISAGIALEGRSNINGYMSLSSNSYLNSAGLFKYIGSDYAVRYVHTAGQHVWQTVASGTAGNTITFTDAMTLDASGGLKTLNTIGVGNATPSASGAGITFPATQSASTDANTLDDYQEYSAPSTACTGALTNSISYRITKIGRVVNLFIPAILGTPTNVTSIVLGFTIPVAFRPLSLTSSSSASILINAAGAATTGMVYITAAGIISIFRDSSGSLGWGTAANSGLNTDFSMSWII